jgi:hypothetical protein
MKETSKQQLADVFYKMFVARRDFQQRLRRLLRLVRAEKNAERREALRKNGHDSEPLKSHAAYRG